MLDLPKPIANYFAADRIGGDALARCFTAEGVVKDEGHVHKGAAAIKQWKHEAAKKYSYTSQPTSYETKDGKVIVTGRVTGNFPGSPVDLRYFFELEGDRIASLEIKP
ncbi:MAG: nuclear transport factor 2 family protein [Steroidobacter sp.]